MEQNIIIFDHGEDTAQTFRHITRPTATIRVAEAIENKRSATYPGPLYTNPNALVVEALIQPGVTTREAVEKI